MRTGSGAAYFPTNDGLTCVVAGWTDAYASPGSSPEEGYRRSLAEVPRLAEFVAHAERVEPLHGMRDQPGFFRKPWGDGWALAGDAGYHKHPLSAQGISDAFRDADLLSHAVS